MIFATAGHVDHGKTLLVKALTGVDTDRLPEEKRRSLTIDLGFAYLPLASGAVLGFVDVPGHERFIRNMLCGVASIDHALLIVAADDGVMPQTREHLAILDLLGVADGTVAITKADRVEPARIAAVEAEVAALLAPTPLAGAPVFAVSALTGVGIEALRAHLEGLAEAAHARPVSGHFRLAVDRVFTIVGAGLVVTGSVFSGAVGLGDQLLVSPAGIPVRVRGIHAQDRKAERGVAGDRCALNIVGPGLGKEGVARGDWVVAPEAHLPTQRIDATVRVLASEARPLAHWTPVHLHLAAADVTGRIAILESRSIAPGESGLAQLVLDRRIGALGGDRFVLRDTSAQRTIGGGQVIDVLPPARGRARPARLAYLRAMALGDDAEALTGAVAAAETVVDLARFRRIRNLDDREAEAAFAKVELVRIGEGETRLGVAPARWAALADSVRRALAAWHEKAPDAVGPTEANLRTAIEPRLPPEVFAAAVPRLVADGVAVREGASLRLPGHAPRMTTEDQALWLRLSPLIREAGLRPPLVRELAEAAGVDARRVETFLARAARLGRVVGAAKNRYYLPETLSALGAIAEDVAAEADDGKVTAAAFRDKAGIGRNLVIELLEYFDRVRFTRRIGDAREVLRPAEEVFGPAGRSP